MVGAIPGFIRRIPRAHAHAATTLGGRAVRPQAHAAARTTSTNIALAGLQLVIGYQWLVSGVDKMLLGTFPAQMGQLLAVQIGSGKLPAYFATLLRALVVPNAPVFGYAVMLGETLAGLGLVAAGLLMLLRPLAEAHSSGSLWKIFARTDRLVAALAPVAATGAGLLGLSYYLLDGAPPFWFMPSLAYGGAIAPGLMVALASLVLVVAQVFPSRTSR
jgi:uncharacterized membrane protein YphA (DoxX/SURF4 family)